MAALAFVSTLTAKMIEPPVRLGAGGRLQYVTDAKGDRIVDFSHAGYRGGGVVLPLAEARVRVSPSGGDDTGRIQAALDYVGGLPLDASGVRGAVLLEAGVFQLNGRLRLPVSGVVLRGAGVAGGGDGTVLVAAGLDRRPLIEIGSRPKPQTGGAAVSVSAGYVPVGATTIQLANAEGLAAGQAVVIERPSTREWIALLGMDDSPGRQGFDWKPGTLNVRWERTIAAVKGNAITLEAPLTLALDATLGGATVRRAEFPGRVENVGVENLRCVSIFDANNLKDEEHAWTAIHVSAARDCWVADVTGEHFAGSLVYVSAGASRVTVQDCVSLAPISEDGGFRRMTFHTMGVGSPGTELEFAL